MNTNLLDLNDDILNIIGGYVKKTSFWKRNNESRTNIKRKKIMFPCIKQYLYSILFDENGNCIKDNITKDEI